MTSARASQMLGTAPRNLLARPLCFVVLFRFAYLGAALAESVVVQAELDLARLLSLASFE